MIRGFYRKVKLREEGFGFRPAGCAIYFDEKVYNLMNKKLFGETYCIGGCRKIEIGKNLMKKLDKSTITYLHEKKENEYSEKSQIKHLDNIEENLD